jgi:long-chain acyl-CoA synthetase
VAEDLHDCRPTIFFAVPRIWEKLRDAIVDQTAARSLVQRSVLQRYLAISDARANDTRDGGWMTRAMDAEWKVLDATVGSVLRRKLGLDRARILVSGAAPIPTSLLTWFDGIGLQIGEAYGQTEDCGPVTLGLRGPAGGGGLRRGSVGKPLPGVEIAIADDDEVLVRAGSVCRGYWANSRDTADLIDRDGWMHTGDLGKVDRDGYVWVTGRKKDLIVMSAGHKVAPQDLEMHLRSEPLVLDAVVAGEGRPYLCALVTLNPQQLAQWAQSHHKLYSLEALAHDPDVHASIAGSIERVNHEVARAETIKRFRILPTPFTADEGELTPTAKVKRNVVISKNSELIEQMYAAPENERRP